MSERAPIDPNILRGDDSTPLRGVTVAALDLDKVAEHLAQARARERYQGPMEPLAYLKQRHFTVEHDGEMLATTAGVLCFGRTPQEVFPRAVVDIGHYSGLQPLSFEMVHIEKEISGTIFDQLARVEGYLWTNTHHGMRVSPTSFQRIEAHEYPRTALRELSINMVAHRDYTNFRSAARVQLFKNRIEWLSPGGLPPGITVENILDEQAARNPVILNALFESGWGEGFGLGLNTVVATLATEEMPPPLFRDTGASFIVTMFGRALDVLSGEGVYGALSESQRRIVAYLRARSPLLTREITALFGDRARRSVQRDISMLVDDGLIRPEGNGRALRYHLVDASATHAHE